jgi:1,4-alpha-glucan branching enzyme
MSQDLDRILDGTHHDPHSFLGAHSHNGATVIRALRPGATAVTVVTSSARVDTTEQSPGLFVAEVPLASAPDYRLDVHYGADVHPVDDPYRHSPLLGELDLHLIGEGRHERLWEALGARPMTVTDSIGPSAGVRFTVWAPSAVGVSVACDANAWSDVSLPMRSLGRSGVWELFLPGVSVGMRYKFCVTGRDGVRRLKADPMAQASEIPHGTASVVTEPVHTWADVAHLRARAETSAVRAPMSIYECHLGSWRRGSTYRELAGPLTEYLTQAGFTHVEFLPVAEHPYEPSWGYQVTSFYAPSARYGTPDDFRFLVDALHRAGISVIVDWVPAHFPKDDWSLGRFDGTPLYEHGDPQRGEQPDWGTFQFDLGRPEVRNFLIANALFWFEMMHVDGLRVDAVASMLYLDYSRGPGQWSPNVHGGRENLEAVAFLQELTATCYRLHPGITMIAEESTAWPGVTRPTDRGGLGFGFKWNMGWMHDTLSAITADPLFRRYHHTELTFSMMYAYSENFVLPLSHDEVVHGKRSLLQKMPGDRWQQRATLRALFTYMWAHPGKQLLFMGGEFGQSTEFSEQRGPDWDEARQPEHVGIFRAVCDLNRAYREHPALWELDSDPAGFSWIDPNDADRNVLTFARYSASGDVVVAVINLSGLAHHDLALGLPHRGEWIEIINTDAAIYGGAGEGNLGRVHADHPGVSGQVASARITVPALSGLLLTPAR